jgi:hypothetical protein
MNCSPDMAGAALVGWADEPDRRHGGPGDGGVGGAHYDGCDLVRCPADDVRLGGRQEATAGQLGNQVGVVPVALPAGGGLAARVTQVAAITRERKRAARGTSAVLLGPAFRLLAPTGLLRWLFDRQRLVHTFATWAPVNLEVVCRSGGAGACRIGTRLVSRSS